MPAERDLVEALGAAVGQQKAREMLRRAADRLFLPPGELSPEALPRVLEELTHVPGVIGLAARRALMQFWRGSAPAQAPAAPAPDPTTIRPRQTASRPELRAHLGAEAPPAPSRSSGVRATARAPVAVADLRELLNRSLGEAKAQELVRSALDARGWQQDPLSSEQALSILDDLSQEPGLVGITARFAKPKLLLRTGT